MKRALDSLLTNAARSYPDAPAISFRGREISYRTLDAMADSAAGELERAGIGRGDRVGIWLDKSPAAVAAMQGTLRLGAAYVPIDPLSPPARARAIAKDCSLAGVITSAGLEIGEPQRTQQSDPDLAYVLYTSGSTGTPKGVCVSHSAALAFVDWAVDQVSARSDDRFSNHAPFHFDLSVLDLYAAFSAGACVCIVPEELAYAPDQLVEFMAGERITIWYSVPSALALMIEHGRLLEIRPRSLRHLLFAGEPFPLRYVRLLVESWPHVPLHNLYGPTETNVCTAFTVGEIEPDRTRPVPIGEATCGNKVWAATPDGREADVGEEGELWVSGPTVMLGYWGHPRQSDRPYATGDLVRRIDGENFEYIGRRDQMLKVRGIRMEAGEIESCLLAHERIAEAAAVVGGEGLNAKLFAFVVERAGTDRARPSLLALKQHCAERLPRAMIPGAVRWLPEMPRTGNGKIDRSKLQTLTKEEVHARTQGD